MKLKYLIIACNPLDNSFRSILVTADSFSTAESLAKLEVEHEEYIRSIEILDI